jgi:hypothetical protein
MSGMEDHDMTDAILTALVTLIAVIVWGSALLLLGE